MRTSEHPNSRTAGLKDMHILQLSFSDYTNGNIELINQFPYPHQPWVLRTMVFHHLYNSCWLETFLFLPFLWLLYTADKFILFGDTAYI